MTFKGIGIAIKFSKKKIENITYNKLTPLAFILAHRVLITIGC